MIRVQCSIYHLLADTCSVRIDLKATFNTGTAYSGELFKLSEATIYVSSSVTCIKLTKSVCKH